MLLLLREVEFLISKKNFLNWILWSRPKSHRKAKTIPVISRSQYFLVVFKMYSVATFRVGVSSFQIFLLVLFLNQYYFFKLTKLCFYKRMKKPRGVVRTKSDEISYYWEDILTLGALSTTIALMVRRVPPYVE